MKFAIRNIDKTTASKPLCLLYCCIAFAICAFILIPATGCANSTPKINLDEFPNTVVENSEISSEYSDIANKFAPQLIDEFMDITIIPHTSNHLDQITQYIQDKIIKYGCQPQLDAQSGCVYVDIPATSSQEWQSKPTVILQSHMDMVCAVEDNYSSFDPVTMAVYAVYDRENSTIHSKDYQTNIGADDGQGMAFMLTVLKYKDNFNHGPIRLLFTSDEEVGCIGAKNLSSNIVDAPYLINLDGYQIGNVLTSSAGSIRGVFTNDFANINPDATDKLITVSISNLAGGHTGVDTVKARLHGERYIMNFFKKLNENNISYKLSLINCGTLSNAYQTSLSFQFYIDQNDVDKVNKIFNEDAQSIKEQYSEDSALIAEISESGANSSSACISYDDSKKIVKLLEELPEGVLAEGSISADVPETSTAIGILKLNNGKFETCEMLRSSNNNTLNEYANIFPKIAQNNGFNYKEATKMSAWPADANNNLKDLMFESYINVGNFQGVETATHGGLETSYFLAKNPNIKMISIGLDYFHEHMATETLYPSTTNMHIASVLYTLQHIN